MNLSKKTRDSILRFLKDKRAQGYVGRPKDLAQDEYFSLKSNSALDQNTNGAFNPFPRGYVFPRDKSQDVIVQPVALVDPFNFPNNPRALGNAFIIGSPSAPGTVQANVAAANAAEAITRLGLDVNSAFLIQNNSNLFSLVRSVLKSDGGSVTVSTDSVASVMQPFTDNINNLIQIPFNINGVNATASAANTAQTVVIDLRNLKDIINVVMTASAGGACTLTYSVSVDNATFAQIGSQAANAASSASWSGLDSVLGTGAPIVSGGAYTVNIPVDPRGYRYLKIVVGAGGAGSVSTITVSCK